MKVKDLFFPVDFIIMDMKEDRKTSIVLGKPFLAISEAMIDVAKGEITFGIDDEKVVFRNNDDEEYF